MNPGVYETASIRPSNQLDSDLRMGGSRPTVVVRIYSYALLPLNLQSRSCPLYDMGPPRQVQYFDTFPSIDDGWFSMGTGQETQSLSRRP